MSDYLRKELETRFPRGEWHAAGRWREEALAQRHPDIVAESMAFLSHLAPAEWFRGEVLARRFEHPLACSLFNSGYLVFWTAFTVGHDLAALKGKIPDSLRGRLLNAREFRGAAVELAGAALLARCGVRFDWFPTEGGEYKVHDDQVRYIEAKHPQYESEPARAEMHLVNELGRSLRDAANGLAVAYALRPNLAEEMPRSARRQLNAQSFASAFTEAIAAMIQAGEVPGRRDLDIGTIWLARTQEEMLTMRAGGYAGFFLDNYGVSSIRPFANFPAESQV
jgi:hypothetical protein